MSSEQNIRDELLPLEDCAKTKEIYGQEVGIPVEGTLFVQYVRNLLTTAANQSDCLYPDNAFFTIINGRPKLASIKKKAVTEGFDELNAALTKKLETRVVFAGCADRYSTMDTLG